MVGLGLAGQTSWQVQVLCNGNKHCQRNLQLSQPAAFIGMRSQPPWHCPPLNLQPDLASVGLLIPTFQVVPVYSQADSEDILVRGYSKCSTYQQRLSEWFTSEEFLNKSAESEPLRNSIAALAPSMNTSLPNWWNV